MNVRELAIQVIDSVYKNKSFSNIELSRTIRENILSVQDKTFLTKLVYGTLKKSNVLDYEIQKATLGKEIKPNMRTLLKASLYQMRFMDKVPDYAVINESVNIAKNNMGLQASKFVNGVLRHLQSNHYEPKLEEFKDEVEYQCFVNGFPVWVGKMVAKHYGNQVSIDWMKSSQLDNKLSLRVNALRTSKEELLKKDYFVEGKLSPCSVLYTGDKSLNELDEFMNGEVAVQGESSQLVSLLLDPKANDKILDMCAAPGGKTYHMADLLQNKGSIVAVDVYPHRVDLLKRNLPRLGITCVKTKVCDATKLTSIFEENAFDKVLLDAPCSGLGIIRKKPDILLNINQDKLDEILALQKQLIDEAVKLVKVGGNLLYSTCTIDKKENENQVKYILETYPNFKLVEQKIIFPNEEVIDGFFMAKLIKE